MFGLEENNKEKTKKMVSTNSFLRRANTSLWCSRMILPWRGDKARMLAELAFFEHLFVHNIFFYCLGKEIRAIEYNNQICINFYNEENVSKFDVQSV